MKDFFSFNIDQRPFPDKFFKNYQMSVRRFDDILQITPEEKLVLAFEVNSFLHNIKI